MENKLEKNYIEEQELKKSINKLLNDIHGNKLLNMIHGFVYGAWKIQKERRAD